MGTYLDMSLDDLIKSRNTGGRGRGRGRDVRRGRGGTSRGWAVGMLRQGPLRVNTRPSTYKIAKSFSRAQNSIWRHDLFNDSMIAAGYIGADAATKLYISNLDYGVSNEDIKELFSEVGDLRRCAIHYDRSGRSTGSAEVIYGRRSDAMAALKRYNNVHLDGKPMKIEEIGASTSLPTTRVNVVGAVAGKGRRSVVMSSGSGQSDFSSFNQVSGWGHDGGSFREGRSRGGIGTHGGIGIRGRGLGRGHGRGRGRGRGRVGTIRGRKQGVSADQLDEELDNYHAAKST